MKTYKKYVIVEPNGDDVLYLTGRDGPPSKDVADGYDYGFNRAMQILSEDRTGRLMVLEIKVTESYEVTYVYDGKR